MIQYNEVLTSINNLSAQEYKKLVAEKAESDDYAHWHKFLNENDSSLNLSSDTTPNNASLTALDFLKNSTSDNLSMMEHFTLKKSILSNYVTMYVKTRIRITEKGSSIKFPFLLVVSDLGYYKEVFHTA